MGGRGVWGEGVEGEKAPPLLSSHQISSQSSNQESTGHDNSFIITGSIRTRTRIQVRILLSCPEHAGGPPIVVRHPWADGPKDQSRTRGWSAGEQVVWRSVVRTKRALGLSTNTVLSYNPIELPPPVDHGVI